MVEGDVANKLFNLYTLITKIAQLNIICRINKESLRLQVMLLY